LEDSGDLQLITTADWAAIKMVSDWLKTFQIATTEMSTTKRPMLSSTRDTFLGLQANLKEIISSLPENINATLRSGLVNAHLKLSEYFGKFDQSQYCLWACSKYSY
jgi:hypothetical protein